ncbi:MAG: hypothetical protein OEM26_07590 [Saprospiraceae bacterium]|nr:hypothetical protein [Saprospiraceae bacterium]
MIIRTRAYPRAALIGNPSDGYFGKTIAFVFSNFHANVALFESPELAIIPQKRDSSEYEDLDELYDDVKLHGYYGGIRLLKATIKKFVEHCRNNRIVLDRRNFTIRYETTIPHRVGLAGSSAIITAAIRALMAFYDIKIPKPLLANTILSVEVEELGISAGLQDRVAQVYETPVFMDFDRTNFQRTGFGKYETLDPTLLPNLYIAYRTDFSEGSEVLHNDLRKRFNNGDQNVLAAMRRFAELTECFYEAMRKRDFQTLSRCMDENFDLRTQISEVGTDNIDMVKLARSIGLCAKFTGSGGAIIGTYQSKEELDELIERMEKTGKYKVIIPQIVSGL